VLFRLPAMTGLGIRNLNISKHARNSAAEQGIAEEEALKQGMAAKSKEFVEKGAGVYAKA